LRQKQKKLYFTKNACHIPLCAVQPKYWEYTIKKELQGYCQPAQVDWSEQINFVFPGPHNWADVFHVIGFFAV